MAGLVVPVVFDEDALVTDLRNLADTAAAALEELRTQAERDGGIPYERLKACQQGEARDGTDLTGCVKTYVHWPTGPWASSSAPAKTPNGPSRSIRSPTDDDTPPGPVNSASTRSPTNGCTVEAEQPRERQASRASQQVTLPTRGVVVRRVAAVRPAPLP